MGATKATGRRRPAEGQSTEGAYHYATEPGSEDDPLMRQMAKSMCRRYEIGKVVGDGLWCEQGTPCDKRRVCTDMAEEILSYILALKGKQRR
jgi:hypothetical protein